jgi:hypothetical protein
MIFFIIFCGIIESYQSKVVVLLTRKREEIVKRMMRNFAVYTLGFFFLSHIFLFAEKESEQLKKLMKLIPNIPNLLLHLIYMVIFRLVGFLLILYV